MFNPEVETKRIIEFIRDYYKSNNLGGVVLGISGGKDSGVVAGLFSLAIGPENVLGLTLPCHSISSDAKDAKAVAEKFGFKLVNADLTEACDILENNFKAALDTDDDTYFKDSSINLKPRLRMSSCYYMAAAMSAITKKTYIVAGTSNACELYVGYFTKGGDSVHDIAVLADLTVEEVIKVGEYIGVPDEVIHKPPADGLSGLTDEDKLGVKYNDIAKVINGELTSGEEYEKIQKLHKKCAHKFNIPTYRKEK